MAESESGQDKTEEPTAKRVRESRERGEVARSRELGTVICMLLGTSGLLLLGGQLARMMMQLMRDNFTLTRGMVVDQSYMGIQLLTAGKTALLAILPFLVVLTVAALVGPIVMGGFLFSTKALEPKFSRLNPLSGIKRMFSANSLVELLKALFKFAIVLVVVLFVLQKERGDLVSIAHESLDQAIIHSVEVVGWSTLWMSCGLIIIAALDVPFQLYQSHKKLLMTKQEVRDEAKDAEGRPEVKQRIRQLQREASQRRMMAAIPNADVIITNPTHYAVAIQYDPAKGGAPMLVAKGSDFLALKLREIAVEHGVQLLESPELARAIYYSTELDQEIPAGLYLAVAQVLAYVYQIRQYRAGQAKRPKTPGDLPIPAELRRNADGKRDDN